jgi:hypothetical protein
MLRTTVAKWLTATTATAVVGGLLASGTPAFAAKAAPAGVGDSGQICLTSAPSYCIKANGTGNQVTITNVAADKANFTVVFASMGLYEWQDGNGNCLREGTGGVVKIENGPCSLTDNTDSWYRVTGNSVTPELENSGDMTLMYTNGDASGDKVWAALPPPAGAWLRWNVPT